MDAQQMIKLGEDLKYLKEELEVNNRLYGSCPDGYVTLETLITYCKDGDYLLEDIIEVARKLNRLEEK